MTVEPENLIDSMYFPVRQSVLKFSRNILKIVSARINFKIAHWEIGRADLSLKNSSILIRFSSLFAQKTDGGHKAAWCLATNQRINYSPTIKAHTI